MSATQTVPRPQTCRQMYLVALPVDIGHHDDIGFPPPGLLRLRGASAAQVQAAAELPYRVVVIDRSTVADAATSAVEARRAALLLARDHDGIVVDMFVPQIVTGDPDDVWASASAQWFAFGYEDSATMTYGLERFGLPELRCASTAPRSMVDAVLVGLASRLIDAWPGAEPTGEHTVSLADIAGGYGQPAEPDAERAARVNLSYVCADDPDDAYLDVTFLDDPAQTLFR